VLRLVCTRGPESGGAPSVYATVSTIGDRSLVARRTGVAVRTMSLGVPTVRAGAAGLLAGAKTLSYALNMACLRWAASEGVDDVLWVSTDGYALEAPTSTVVWLEGDTLYTVPVAPTGILAGTVAAHLLARAGELGWTARERMVTPAELTDADGVWLTSSGRGLARVHTLDGVALRPSSDTARIAKVLGFSL
jgi:4-amino-4-deoxychorismate lyase